jgi:hypothetical protein
VARYILLQVSNDADADSLVEAINNNQTVGDEKLHHVFYGTPKDPADPRMGGLKFTNLPTDVSVRGMWQKPTKYCDCTTRDRARGFSLSKKYKWWVHAACGKPTESWATNIGERLFQALGKNLIPVSTDAPEWRGEGVRGHKWDPDRKLWVNVQTGQPK